MVELWLKSNDTGLWNAIDVGTELSIAINKSYEEIEDFQTKKSTYSKTFTIPQTERNNKFFITSYSVNSSGFDNDIVVDAVIKYGGADVFNGSCRLNRVINSRQGGAYEIFLTQELPNFASNLQDVKMVALSYSGLTHKLNYDNIVSTWSYSGGGYENYTGLTGTLLYPLGFYGYEDTQYYSLFDTSISGFTNSGAPLSASQFAPWISAKYLIDSVFDKAGFTYTSNFFNSDYFNGIFCLMKGNDTMGARQVSAATQNQNIFSVLQGTPTFVDNADGNFNTNYYKGFVFRTILNNPLNIFSPSRNNTASGRGHFFTTAVNGVYKFKCGFTMQLQNNYLPATYLNIAVKDVDSGTIYTQIQGISIIAGNPYKYGDIYLNATIPAGRRVALYYSRQDGGGDPYAQIRISGAYWELYSSPIILTDLNVLIQDNFPTQLSCLDFFKGITDTFNLVVIPDGERNFLVETWDTYFSSGIDLDWSQKLDISQDYTLEPTTTLTKEYILKYKDSNDRYSLINQQSRNQQFGTSRNISNANFHIGSKTIEVPFEPLPINTFDGITPSNILIPHIYTWNNGAQGNTSRFTPFGSELRLGFYNGLMTSSITGETINWYLLSGSTAVAHNTYPSISHLSAYEYSASTFSDLNFQNQYDFWQVPNDTYIGYTSHDVVNDFWGNRIAQLYANDVKIFNGTFKLTPTEINNINFNDKVYFLNAWWRLLSMTDADITDVNLVKCQFIKLPYFTIVPETLIPPTYEQATPPPPVPTPSASTFTQVVFTGDNITTLCNETASQTPVYSNCAILSAGCSVFQDTSATIPVREATLLKVGGENTIYQVIEYGILTTFQIC